MNLQKIHILNLFSYDDTEINLQNYNVVVGPNNSGKTNLVRVLKLLQTSNQFTYTDLPQEFKFNKDKPTLISLHLKLSDEETRILLQYIFHKSISKQQFPEHIKNIQLSILWTDTVSPDSRPQNYFCRFNNGITLFHEHGDTSISYHEKIDDVMSFMLSFKKNSLKLHDPEISEKFEATHKISPNHLFDDEEIFIKFLEEITSLREFFILDGKTCRLNHSLTISYNSDPPKHFEKEGFDFIEIVPTTSHNSDLWQVLDHILQKNIVIMKEFNFNYDSLVFNLQNLNQKGEKLYKRIQSEFEHLFEGITFELRTVTKKKPYNEKTVETHIIIIETNEEEFLLKHSASGFFEAITILYSILNTKDHVIVLDEPALHLHPNKISDLSQQLMKMPSNARNQIIIITHSPYFLPYDVFFQDYLFNWNYLEKESDRLRLRRFLINTFGNDWKSMYSLEKIDQNNIKVRNKKEKEIFLELCNSELLIKTDVQQIKLPIKHDGKNVIVFSRNLPSSVVSYVKKLKRKSIIIQPKNDFSPTLKPYLFKPDVFFSKFTVLVEGAGDEMALKSISDFLWGLFQHHNITVVNVNGKENIDLFAAILKTYEIPYVAMVDDDYSGLEDVIKHDGKLEDILEHLGWDRRKGEHIDPNEAYEFVSNLIRTEDGRKKIMNSSLGKPIHVALSHLEIPLDSI